MEAARTHGGIEVTVPRLLEAERDRPPGGEVTYLAQVAAPEPAEHFCHRADPAAWLGRTARLLG